MRIRPTRSRQTERTPHRARVGTMWIENDRPSRRWAVITLHYYEHSSERPFVRVVEIQCPGCGHRLMSEDRFLRLFKPNGIS